MSSFMCISFFLSVFVFFFISSMDLYRTSPEKRYMLETVMMKMEGVIII